jgi:hypothetical protein
LQVVRTLRQPVAFNRQLHPCERPDLLIKRIYRSHRQAACGFQCDYPYLGRILNLAIVLALHLLLFCCPCISTVFPYPSCKWSNKADPYHARRIPFFSPNSDWIRCRISGLQYGNGSLNAPGD